MKIPCTSLNWGFAKTLYHLVWPPLKKSSVSVFFCHLAQNFGPAIVSPSCSYTDAARFSGRFWTPRFTAGFASAYFLQMAQLLGVSYISTCETGKPC